MSMNELERRALMGDQQAQQECTEKGIVLPCPFCGNDKNIISNWGMFRCWCPNCLAKAEDSLTRNNAIKSWNTRPAPPIGRCKDCRLWYQCEDIMPDGKQADWGTCGLEEREFFDTSEDYYCSDFVAKESK